MSTMGQYIKWLGFAAAMSLAGVLVWRFGPSKKARLLDAMPEGTAVVLQWRDDSEAVDLLMWDDSSAIWSGIEAEKLQMTVLLHGTTLAAGFEGSDLKTLGLKLGAGSEAASLWVLAKPSRSDIWAKKPALKGLQPTNYVYKGIGICTYSQGERVQLAVAETSDFVLVASQTVILEEALAQLDRGRVVFGDDVPAYSSGVRCLISGAYIGKLASAGFLLQASEQIATIGALARWWCLDLEHIGSAIRGNVTILPTDLASLSGWMTADVHDSDIFHTAEVLPDNVAFWCHLPIAGVPPDIRRTLGSEAWLPKIAVFALPEPASAADGGVWVFPILDSSAFSKAEQMLFARGIAEEQRYQTFDLRRPAGSSGEIWYTVVERKVIVAPSATVLKKILDRYLTGRVLANQPAWQQWFMKASLLLPVQVFMQPAFWSGYCKTTASSVDWANFCSRRLENIAWLGGSCDFQDGYVNLPLHGRVASEAMLPSGDYLWKTTLQDAADTPPMPVRFADDVYIFVQDVQHIAYLIASDGSIRWKKRLDGNILSEVFEQHDPFDGRTRLLFNTATRIHLLDSLGQEARSYPIRLQSAATTGLCAADFEHTGQWHFFVPCANGNIYGFDPLGKPIVGWMPKEHVGDIYFPGLHLQHGGKDFLVFVNTQQQLMAFARDGSLRFPTVVLPSNSYLPPTAVATESYFRIAQQLSEDRVLNINARGEHFELAISGRRIVLQPEGRQAAYHCLTDSSLQIFGYRGQTFGLLRHSVLGRGFQGLQVIKTPAGPLTAAYSSLHMDACIFGHDSRPLPGFPITGTQMPRLADMFNDGRRIAIVACINTILTFEVPD